MGSQIRSLGLFAFALTIGTSACGPGPAGSQGGTGGGATGGSATGSGGTTAGTGGATAGSGGATAGTGGTATGSGGTTAGTGGTTAGTGGRTGTGGATTGTGGGAATGGRSGSGGAGGGSLGAWELLAPMPGGARQEHGVAAVGGLVYAIGNFGTAAASRRLEAYNPATNQWMARAMLPFSADHPNVAATADKIYILGARNTTMSAEYDPVADSWTMKAPLPTERNAAATAAIDTKIYVAGGQSASASVSDFAAYDTVANTWETLPAVPGPARNHGPGVAFGGVFYVLGGRSGPPDTPATGLQSRVDAYDPGTRQWSSKAPMPRARGGTAAGVVNGIFLVVGGEGNEQVVNPMRVFPETDAYDPTTNTWRTLTNMRTPRHGMGAAGVGAKLYVPGGATAQGGGTAVAILEAFTP